MTLLLKSRINNTINLFVKTAISILVISNHNCFRVLYISFEKYTYILALEMASPWNQHCANCIGKLSFRIAKVAVLIFRETFFSARRYACAVYAVVVCPSVCLSVCLSVRHKPVLYRND